AAFAVTWGIGALLVLAGPQVEALTGEFSTRHPLYYLAVAAPSLSAIALTAVLEGRSGLRALVARVLRWRVHPGWYALILLGWPVADLLARALQTAVTGAPFSDVVLNGTPPTPLDQWYLAPMLLLATLILDAGPLGEELGWRGYALPRMLARWRPLPVAVVLGAVWGMWHLPAFFIAGTAQSDQGMGLGWLVLGCVFTSVLMTWLYLRTASVLVSGILVHLMNNSVAAGLWATVAVMTVPTLIAGIALARRGVGRPVSGRTADGAPPGTRPSGT
ncbi:MAG: lysostaphin resistance A-like protein, partial [Dermatophilaceae bacterium]